MKKTKLEKMQNKLERLTKITVDDCKAKSIGILYALLILPTIPFIINYAFLLFLLFVEYGIAVFSGFAIGNLKFDNIQKKISKLSTRISNLTRIVDEDDTYCEIDSTLSSNLQSYNDCITLLNLEKKALDEMQQKLDEEIDRYNEDKNSIKEQKKLIQELIKQKKKAEKLALQKAEVQNKLDGMNI